MQVPFATYSGVRPADAAAEVETVTARPANPTQLGGRRARPIRRVVLSGNTLPARQARRAHMHGVDRGKTPRAENTSCVTGSLLACFEGLAATLTPRTLIPSTARMFPSNPQKRPPQTPSEGRQEPSSHGQWGQSQRRTVEASDTALRRDGGRVLHDTLAAPQCPARGVRAFPPMSGQRHIGHTLQKRVSNSPLASSRGG